MDTNQIRRIYLDFFAARDHTVVPSASLIPVDPTLLLTNAGMVPFKPYMLGEETPPYVRAVTVQKVARTVDIDIIGTTARHLTFFEMLGNFSFGDYYKERAIPWSFDLMTEGFGLDSDRLWYTVHETDDEAEQIWIDDVGVSPDRVQRRDRDNFWQMGVPGPCGPSSEIFYDKGPEYGPDGGPVVDEERFVEVWNLVFMQNIQDEPYHVIGDLPAKNIDTGAGLERIATVVQEVDSVFEIDAIRPVVATAEGATKTTFGASEGSDVSLRIMADHGRAVTFLIGDKVVPSNEGRGYVLRRLLRRIVRHASLLGARDLVLPDLIASTVDVMGEAYPELAGKQDAITEMAEREEVRFRRTLESGHQLLDEELATMDPGAVFPGATAFKLHDTYGFPRELTEEILAERGIQIDLDEFHRMMDEQRERARRHYKGGKAAELAEAYRALLRSVDTTEFTGYEAERDSGRLLAVVREGETVERAEAGQDVEVFLDRTPLYAESGGQIGDSGIVTAPTGSVRITDTQYSLPGIHGHRGRVETGYVEAGQEVTVTVDENRRERIRKNHTGTHLLHWGLRTVIGDHVHQAGSLVADDRLRFDFSHFTASSREELYEVEQAVNSRIVENSAVTTLETSKDEAEEMGALAFFGDKYGERVRVVKVGDYSTEFCGGTHVPTAGQIGPLILVSEGSVAANTRRLEAFTGVQAYEYLSGMRRAMEEAAGVLQTRPDQLVPAIGALRSRLEEYEERVERFEAQARSAAATSLLDGVETHGEHSLLVTQQPGLGADELRALAFQVRDRIGSGVGVFGSARDGKGALLAFVSRNLVDLGVSAADVLSGAARVLGGGGSKDPEMAQAGGPHGDRLEDALVAARDAARAALLEV
jgi:alanyl-tRNA synthetase